MPASKALNTNISNDGVAEIVGRPIVDTPHFVHAGRSSYPLKGSISVIKIQTNGLWLVPERVNNDGDSVDTPTDRENASVCGPAVNATLGVDVLRCTSFQYTSHSRCIQVSRIMSKAQTRNVPRTAFVKTGVAQNHKLWITTRPLDAPTPHDQLPRQYAPEAIHQRSKPIVALSPG